MTLTREATKTFEREKLRLETQYKRQSSKLESERSELEYYQLMGFSEVSRGLHLRRSQSLVIQNEFDLILSSSTDRQTADESINELPIRAKFEMLDAAYIDM